jgi:uncharacterized membrane protein HdeD (DUF308 family)
MNSNSLSPTVSALAERWWAVLIRGLAAILFGIIAIARPGAGLLALVAIWAIYAIVDGIFNLVAAMHGAHEGRRWGWLVFEGVISILAGVVTFAWPGMTALVLVMLIAVWAVITGIAEIAAAISLRHVIEREWLLGASGLLSILFGILLFIFPSAGALSLVFLIGIYAILFGVMLVALGFKLERLGRPRTPPITTRPSPGY